MVAMLGWGAAAAEQQGWRKGPWTPEEDKLLSQYVNMHGEGRWSSVARGAGLNRSGKSCRLRWVNYLRPGLKRGQITPQEEGFIVELHALWGNKWSTIARYLPGRTDNEIKNFWRTHFKKKDKCTQKQEKRKAQLLKAKQEQEQEQESEQQQLQDDRNKVVKDVAQTRQENMDFTMYPIIENQEYQSLPVLMNQGSIESWSKIIGEDGLFLDRLWNLDDNDQHHTSLSQCNRLAMQNQGITASSAGDMSTAIIMHNEARGLTWGGSQCSNNVFYGGDYIF